MNMGIKGAALATVVSRMVSCVFVLWFLLGKDTKLRLRFRNMRLNKSILTRVLALGASPFFMTTSEGVMHICFNMRVLKYGGDIAVSAMTVLFSMFQFINLPLTGISQGSQPIVGFNSAPDLVSLGSRMLRVYISGCFFIGANSLYQQTYTSMREGKMCKWRYHRLKIC